MADGQMFDDTEAETALRTFREFLDAHPEIGLAWAMDKGDTLACEMKARFAPTARGRTSQPMRTLAQWMQAQPDPNDVLPPDHAVFRWADSMGLPEYYVYLGWCWFRRTYGPNGRNCSKKYRDWLAVFDDSVRDRWGKLWYPNGDSFKLSADGEILAREYPNEERA